MQSYVVWCLVALPKAHAVRATKEPGGGSDGPPGDEVGEDTDDCFAENLQEGTDM
jgi:hypothetical protein